MINKLDSDAPFTVGLVFRNKAGKTVPAPDGAMAAWSLDSDTILTQAPSSLTDLLTILGPDGTATLTVVVAGLTGTVQIQVSGDPTPATVEIVAI